MKLSVIVPVYNELQNIGGLFRKIKSELQKLSLAYEIIFVDDGSTDGTAEKIKEIRRGCRECRLIILKENYGQSEAIMAGFQTAEGDYIITMDGGLRDDPADIIKVIIALQSGYDMVCGWRESGKDSLLLKRIPSRIANALISYVTKVRIHDLGCSLRGYRRHVIENINLCLGMHRFVPVFAASIGAHIMEVPVTHGPGMRNKSRHGIAFAWKMLLDLIRVKIIMDFSSRPARLFVSLSIPFWFTGIFFTGRYMLHQLNVPPYHDSIVYIGVGILYLFLAFSLVAFGFLTELVVATGDYKQNKIIGIVSCFQKKQ